MSTRNIIRRLQQAQPQYPLTPEQHVHIAMDENPGIADAMVRGSTWTGEQMAGFTRHMVALAPEKRQRVVGAGTIIARPA